MQSLNACESLDVSEMKKKYCYTGVFSELVNNRNINPIKFKCTDLDKKYQVSCESSFAALLDLQSTNQRNFSKNILGCKGVVDDSGNMKLTTHEGTFATGQKLPADWPTDAPVYAGADVQYSASVNPTNGKPGKAVVLMTKDDTKAVESFYESELVKQGWTIAEDAHTPVGYVVSATKDTRILSLMVGGAEGRTTITLGVSEAE
jgi:hypothetical protein